MDAAARTDYYPRDLAAGRYKPGVSMSDIRWNTTEEASSIMMAQFALIRELAVELKKLNGLDDRTLEAIQQRASRKVKGMLFEGDDVSSDKAQVSLVELKLAAIDGALKFVKINRDNGNLDE
jgi:hypothetical protein